MKIEHATGVMCLMWLSVLVDVLQEVAPDLKPTALGGGLVTLAYLGMAAFVAWGRFGPESFT